RLQTGRHVHFLLHFVDGSNRASQSRVGSQIKRDRNRGKLALMVDREILGGALKVSKCAERHGITHGRSRGGVRGVRCARAWRQRIRRRKEQVRRRGRGV